MAEKELSIGEALTAMNEFIAVSRPFLRVAEMIPRIEEVLRLVGTHEAAVQEMVNKRKELESAVAKLKTDEQKLRKTFNSLDSEYAAKRTALEAGHAKSAATIQKDFDADVAKKKLVRDQSLDSLNEEIRSTEEDLARARNKLREATDNHAALMAKRDQEIAAKQAELDTVTKAFEEFKKFHGMS